MCIVLLKFLRQIIKYGLYKNATLKDVTMTSIDDRKYNLKIKRFDLYNKPCTVIFIRINRYVG